MMKIMSFILLNGSISHLHMDETFLLFHCLSFYKLFTEIWLNPISVLNLHYNKIEGKTFYLICILVFSLPCLSTQSRCFQNLIFVLTFFLSREYITNAIEELMGCKIGKIRWSFFYQINSLLNFKEEGIHCASILLNLYHRSRIKIIKAHWQLVHSYTKERWYIKIYHAF